MTPTEKAFEILGGENVFTHLIDAAITVDEYGMCGARGGRMTSEPQEVTCRTCQASVLSALSQPVPEAVKELIATVSNVLENVEKALGEWQSVMVACVPMELYSLKRVQLDLSSALSRLEEKQQ